MGRTVSKRYDDEDDYVRKKPSKNAKHSHNIPGKGMRVINSWSVDDYDNQYNDDLIDTDEYYDNTSQTQRK